MVSSKNMIFLTKVSLILTKIKTHIMKTTVNFVRQVLFLELTIMIITAWTVEKGTFDSSQNLIRTPSGYFKLVSEEFQGCW